MSGRRPRPISGPPLHGSLQTCNSEREMALLRGEAAWREDRHNTITLRNGEGTSVVLLAMKVGDKISYIGPCIRECCYEVSEELAETLVGKFGAEVVSERSLSLPGAIRTDLASVGTEQVHDLGICTGCRSDLFYSHGKQGPLTDRSLAIVARDSS